MAHIDKYLKLAVSKRASDIHLTSGEPCRMRVDGDLVVVEQSAFDSQALTQMLFEILSEEERRKFTDLRNLDKSYSLEDAGNFRVNIFMTRRGIAAVLRTIPSKIPTIADLGLPDVVMGLTELGKGLVLVTGPTGSGKSTTLAAMLHHINCNFPYHILTAEDPVEFVHDSRKSLINQREIGQSCPSFSEALKYALREDPDVILVGEMRDLETIGLAMTAAETGHLVFGTLHTRGAAASIDRIIDSFPANQQAMVRTMLSESLAAVISQALLKRADGQGRVAAYEIMVVNHAISNLIREGKTFQITSIMQTARKEGMILMDQHIRDLVNSGMVTKEEASAYTEEGSAVSVKPKTVASSTVPPKTGISTVAKAPTAAAPRPTAAVAQPPRPGAAPVAPPRPGAPPAPSRSATAGGPPPIKPPALQQPKLPGGFAPLSMNESKAPVREKPQPPPPPSKAAELASPLETDAPAEFLDSPLAEDLAADISVADEEIGGLINLDIAEDDNVSVPIEEPRKAAPPTVPLKKTK